MKTLFKMFKQLFTKKSMLLIVTEKDLIKRHINDMKEGIIGIDNWHDHFTIQGHGPEIEIAEGIFGTPQDTKDLNLDYLDADTGTWVYIALEWLHCEQDMHFDTAYKKVITGPDETTSTREFPTNF